MGFRDILVKQGGGQTIFKVGGALGSNVRAECGQRLLGRLRLTPQDT